VEDYIFSGGNAVFLLQTGSYHLPQNDLVIYVVRSFFLFQHNVV
jgi:hypothetical protein